MSERKNPYEIIGGATKVEELVDRFYDLMALEESFAELRAMHSEDLTNSRDKLKLFYRDGWEVRISTPQNMVTQCCEPDIYLLRLALRSAINGWLACIEQWKIAALMVRSAPN